MAKKSVRSATGLKPQGGLSPNLFLSPKTYKTTILDVRFKNKP